MGKHILTLKFMRELATTLAFQKKSERNSLRAVEPRF